MDAEILSHFDTLEKLIRDNYTNLNDKIEKVETNIKNDVLRVEGRVEALSNRRQDDHDNLVNLQSKVESQQESFVAYKQQEQSYGRAMNAKIDSVEDALSGRVEDAEQEIAETKKKVDTLSISYGKLIGIALGGGLCTGIVLFFLNLLVQKLKQG